MRSDLPSEPANAPDIVLACALVASGGNAWLSVCNFEITGQLHVGGLSGPYRQAIDLVGGRFAITFSLGPHAFAGGFDGTRGWQRSPNGEVLVQDADAALRAAATDAWLNARGWWFAQRWPAQREALARVVEGDAVFDVLRCLPAGGQSVDLWFDAALHRLARIVTEVLGKPSIKRLADYREVCGLWLPFRTTSGSGDPRFDRVNEVEAVAVDVEWPESTFQAPLQQVDDVVYARQRVLLKPNAAHGTPFAADRAGLWLNRRNDAVIVKAVMAEGPAAAAGLQPGDVLCDIDGTPAASVTLDALRRQLRERPAGQVLVLRVAREGRFLNAALCLQDLIPAA